MIDLLDRRFVCFYYNTFRGGTGYDAKAAAFIAKHDKRFSGMMVPTPPVWVFSPQGELLSTIDNYTPKHKFYAALREVLAKHEQYDQLTTEEQQTLTTADQHKSEPTAQLAAARLCDQLGQPDRATRYYQACIELGADSQAGANARLALARFARFDGKWDDAKPLLAAIETANKGNRFKLADDVAMEQAHALLANKEYAQARKLLDGAIKASPRADRMGEMHFYCGVACFMLEQRDWANFHWCWVMSNIPSDLHYMRCFMAATADAMPYPNLELGGYRGKSNSISLALADAARVKAMEDFKKLMG